MSIIKLLNKKLDRLIFTTPTHDRFALFSKKYENFYKYDFSEIEGFDNLSDPRGAIMLAQYKASSIFNTKQTFFVTQGSTTAILASMKALIKPGDKVLVARNCHKSVFSGLILTAGVVDWFMPEFDEDWGIYTTIDIDKLNKTLDINEYKAFIMTSPTYEGINSDVEAISMVCKNHGVYLIVDEAHGSLYNFNSNLPRTAIEQGADVSVNSLHKTAGALNQTALLHVSKDIQNVEVKVFQNALNLFQTTSPSYPLLENIEECLKFLSSDVGKAEISKLIEEIIKFKNNLKRFGVEFYDDKNHDLTKILLRKHGINGIELSQILYDNYNIEDEMNNSICCLYLTGIGTTKQKLEKLKNALKKIPTNPSYSFDKQDSQPYPIVKIQPVDTFKADYTYVSKNNSLMKISNRMIIPYPPGIGLLYPGEAIQKWHLDYLNNDVEVMDL